jgi:electron transfer flavoprotein alpha subunit
MTDVLIVAELLDGKPRRSTLSAIAFGKEIAGKTNGAFDVLAIGEGSSGAADELTGYGARKVLRTEVAGGYVAERYAPTIAEVGKSGGYGIVAMPASAVGKDLAPRVAGKLDSGIASDIVGVEIANGAPVYKRSMYAGNVFGKVTITTPVHVVSVRQSEFDPAAPSGGSSPVSEVAAVDDPAAARVEFVAFDRIESERPELTEAEIVVSGGRALASAENFKTVLEPLVDALGAAMGASRAACDAGYVPGDLQVGQTGKVVTPKLYVAVGISGAIQHLAGMKGSKTIVAINKDKEAPIAQVADYFLVGDLFTVVPAFTEAVKKVKAAG